MMKKRIIVFLCLSLFCTLNATTAITIKAIVIIYGSWYDELDSSYRAADFFRWAVKDYPRTPKKEMKRNASSINIITDDATIRDFSNILDSLTVASSRYSYSTDVVICVFTNQGMNVLQYSSDRFCEYRHTMYYDRGDRLERFIKNHVPKNTIEDF